MVMHMEYSLIKLGLKDDDTVMNIAKEIIGVVNKYQINNAERIMSMMMALIYTVRGIHDMCINEWNDADMCMKVFVELSKEILDILESMFVNTVVKLKNV